MSETLFVATTEAIGVDDPKCKPRSKQTVADFRNESGLVFTDISGEKRRKYVFSDGAVTLINSPVCLHVSKSGGHYVYDGTRVWYVPVGWINLTWEVYKGQAHMSF